MTIGASPFLWLSDVSAEDFAFCEEGRDKKEIVHRVIKIHEQPP